MPDQDIYRAYNFKLELGGGGSCAFTEVSGLEVTIEPIEFREGGSPWSGVRKLPGRVNVGDVTLKWGESGDMYLWNWVQKLAAGTFETKNVSIILMKPNGKDKQPNMTWNLNNAWIRAWRGAKLDAMGQQVLIEEVTLVAESVERA